MSVKHSSVTVGTSASSLLGGVVDGSGNKGDVAFSSVFTNIGATSVFIGSAAVTTSSYGYELKAGASIALDLTAGDDPYGVVATGTAVVKYLHTGA